MAKITFLATFIVIAGNVLDQNWVCQWYNSSHWTKDMKAVLSDKIVHGYWLVENLSTLKALRI